MTHLRSISRGEAHLAPAQLDIAETIILGLITVFFNGWDNFASVIQNLQKYYSKTP